MQALDFNRLFARAEQAFGAGRLDDARRDLEELIRAAGSDPAVLHLLALVHKKGGDKEAARRAFERARTLAPRDPQLAGNYANLLRELGENEQALELYGAALAADPGFADARYNRALLLQELGRPREALADLETIAADARTLSARGSVLRELGRLEEAAASYDAALAIEPARLRALHGRARVAMELGEPGAPAFYAKALQQQPADLDVALGLAEALEAEGNPDGLRQLAALAEDNPGWVAGHEVLARMRYETGQRGSFADHYPRAIARRPADRQLHVSYWQSLARAERFDDALAALRDGRRHLEDDGELQLLEASFLSEAGDPKAALALLDGVEGPAPALVQGRAALRAGAADRAAELLERVVRIAPELVAGWAHLDLCWRLTGDDRHGWLSGQNGLYAARDIGLGEEELVRLAELLRSWHRTRSHPIGQSLRGGTQTRGRLFARREPEIRSLETAILAAVHDHFRALPPRDEKHPLLAHRDGAPAIAGSWSVRLGGQGFHVNHIHPEGVLSSACYISLPTRLAASPSHEGWLELGRPPPELGLALEPLATIEPRPGRLALFPAYLFHGTRPFADGERLTVAFDVIVR